MTADARLRHPRRTTEERLRDYLKGSRPGAPQRALPKALYYVTFWDRESYDAQGRPDPFYVIARRRRVEAEALLTVWARCCERLRCTEDEMAATIAITPGRLIPRATREGAAEILMHEEIAGSSADEFEPGYQETLIAAFHQREAARREADTKRRTRTRT